MPKESKKFYAVRVGYQPGIYTNWPDCKAQTEGCKGTQYKSFKSRDEAQAYIDGQSSSQSSTSSRPPKQAAKHHNEPLKQIWTPEFERGLVANGCIIAFADGACRSNGKAQARAGSGVHWVHPKAADCVSERTPGKQTNQCAELYALLRALETDPDPTKRLYVFSDSTYSIKCMNEWVPGWMNKNWRTKDGKEPENIDLIKLVHFRATIRPAKVEFSWVKAHCGTESNELADQYASRGAGLPDVSRDFVDELQDLIAERQREKRKKAATVVAAQEDKRRYIPISQKAQVKQENAAFCSGLRQADDFNEDWLLNADEEEAEVSGL